MKWYLAINLDGQGEIFEFKNEVDLTLCIWEFQDRCPGLHMAIAYGVEG